VFVCHLFDRLLSNSDITTGLSFYNCVLGGDSPIFVEGGYSGLTITLSNSVLYGNVFAQSGSATLSVPAGTYELNIATTIVGGIPVNPPLPQTSRNQFYTGYQPASLTVQDGGTFNNYGGMYAFNSGTLTFSVGQQTLLNKGLIAANAGTVDLTAAPSGLVDNEGSLLATNIGTIASALIWCWVQMALSPWTMARWFSAELSAALDRLVPPVDVWNLPDLMG
jgi:hypothetical protein